VSDLFDVHLGIRTGNNHVFIVPASLVQQMETAERDFFRPLANIIKRGRIQSPQFVFYPYDNGKLAITSEAQLRSLVPVFYSARLKPSETTLQGRSSKRGRRWWELVEPRLSWLTFGGPRIVSTAFGRRGAFAFDAAGEYAIIQGDAWLWKGSRDLSTEEWFAYLAVLNSPIFEAVIDYFCPQTQGGQYDFSKRFMGNIPLPDMTLLAKREKKRLTECGRAIHEGKRVPLDSHSTSAAAAFGVKLEDFITAFPFTPSARLEMDFEQLASKWKVETGMLSRLDEKYTHTAYQQIIGMGEAAIPFILRDLKETRGHWFWALRAISGESPVPQQSAGDINKVIEAWLEWGRKKGYAI
jgi:hypothetical protein